MALDLIQRTNLCHHVAQEPLYTSGLFRIICLNITMETCMIVVPPPETHLHVLFWHLVLHRIARNAALNLKISGRLASVLDMAQGPSNQHVENVARHL